VQVWKGRASVHESISDREAQTISLLGIGKLYDRINQQRTLVWMI
jgi:hypothetical protein